MVDLSPFAAIRYAAGPDLSKVLAPPYDVIDAAEQDALYQKDPHNIIRIDLNRAETSDHPDSRYGRAAEILASWQASGVLRAEERPSIYVLAQSFVGPDGAQRTRTGFFSRARLVRFDEGQILPHERTLRGPKLDRLKLYRATRTNLSPIFGAYRDPRREVLSILEEAKRAEPIATAVMAKVENRLWRIAEGPETRAISEKFREKKLYIADGHHRYETGLAYRDERREGQPLNPDAGYEHILMFSAAVEDPGMVIFPTHRLVHSLPAFDEAKMMGALGRFFTIRALGADPAAAQTALSAARGDNAFVVVTRTGRHLLVLSPAAPLHEVPALPARPALRSLDVSVLHAVVLESILGITPEAQASQANLRYSKDWQEAFSSPATDPSVSAAFLMNPTEIDEVIEVAESGDVMPQKSTFFYPKIPTGLVLYPLG
ncbi:MAG: DUF1015 domain-containing protein [Myxococcota bacterium]